MADDTSSHQCTFCLKPSATSSTVQKSCDHIICSDCADKIRGTDRQCPKCRKLPSPTTNEDLYDDVPPPLGLAGEAGSGTLETNDAIYCDTISESAQIPDNPIYDRTCPEHNQRNEFFCNTCTTASCSRCLLTSHRIGKHDVSSLDEFLDVKLREIDEKMGVLKNEVNGLEKTIDESQQLSEGYAKSLASSVEAKQVKANSAVLSLAGTLTQTLEENKTAATEFFSGMEARRKGLVANIDQSRKLVNTLLEASNGAKQKIPLEEIEKRVSDIGRSCHEMKDAELPDKLRLILDDENENISSLFLGRLVTLPPKEDTRMESYANSSKSSKWKLCQKMDLGAEEFDYANIIPITDNWFVHVSTLYVSPDVTIKHYTLEDGMANGEPVVLRMDHHGCTLAKSAGRDRSILLASGNTVHRISFRRKNMNFKQKMEVPFLIEALSWDEFGVDCYLLVNNRRDVHWLSMNGTVTFLCSLQNGIQSASSMLVNSQCIISVLDPAQKMLYMKDFPNSSSNERVPLIQPLPEGVKSEESHTSMPLAMAWCQQFNSYYALFSSNDSVIVGEYDAKCRFRKWVVVSKIPAENNIHDLAVTEGSLILLFDSTVAVYKIDSE